MPSLTGAVVLVTGANGGLGTEFVNQALARGAKKVYASARTPRDWNDDRIVPLPLDITDGGSIASAVAIADDVTVLVNNAGISVADDDLATLPEESLRAVMETNFFGPVLLAKAFAPVLARAGVSTLVDVHSALSWVALTGAYSASKAALWSATNSLRLELAPQGTHVVGLHVGYVDTPMAVGVDAPKSAADDVVRAVYEAVENDEYEVLADDTSISVKSALSSPLEALYPALAR